MDAKIKEIMADILEVDPAAITPEFSQAKAELWDSLNALRMATAFEAEFGVKLSMAQISTMDTFAKIKSVLEAAAP